MPHPDFPGAAGYLNTASIGLPPAPAVKAMQAGVGDWATGRATAPGYDIYVARSRDLWARMHGVDPAHVAIGPQVSLPPVAAGWYSAERPWDHVYGGPLRLAGDARRLDLSPAWLSWVGTLAALEYVAAAGVESIHSHNLALANALRDALGLPPGNSAIVSVERDGAAQALAAAGLRAGGLTGAARVCFHLYNDEDDVDAVLSALSAGGSSPGT